MDNSLNLNRELIAVIDTETNWWDKVMSIGVAIADKETFELVHTMYFILNPEYQVGGMYSNTLFVDKDDINHITTRAAAIQTLKEYFKTHHIHSIFAYNANFDYNHLPELQKYNWYDIMGLAAYKAYNPSIPENAETYKTGKLKRNYGVEPTLRRLLETYNYEEVHNGVKDAMDELMIMRLLGHPVETYERAKIGKKKAS